MIRRFSMTLALVALCLTGWANLQLQAQSDPSCHKRCGCGDGLCYNYRSCSGGDCWTCECSGSSGCGEDNFTDECDSVPICAIYDCEAEG